MPIYDLGYRHWKGRWTSHPYRWWVITRQGISLLARKKRFVFLMIAASIPFLVRTVMLYVGIIVGKNLRILQGGPKFFEDFLTQQLFFAFAVAIYSGAGLISSDLRANALQIYLSKPITRWDYIFGKLGIVLFFLAMPTLIPALLLFMMQAVFEANATFIADNYWVLGSIASYAILIIFTLGLIILAFSSLSKSSRFAGINFAAVFFFSQIFHAILGEFFRTSRLAWLSIVANLSQVGDFLFGSAAQYKAPVWASVLVLAGLMAGSVWIIHRRIQAVEVVR